MYQKAELQVAAIPELIGKYKGDLKLVPGEGARYSILLTGKHKNQDSLPMMEKAKELAKALEEIRA